MNRVRINGDIGGRCGRCNSVLSEDGLCPACLLRDGLNESVSMGGLQPGADPGLAVPGEGPTAETLELPAAVDGYKVLAEIGRGGMGIVYLAEQDRPLRRRVALKLIKLGMDTRQVIARFDAERQALALMDHPGVAKVLSAGASGTGRPYFVMELVRGPRITHYCDQFHLSTRERLELFLEVCRAIQHAHQKGIIHRDIKPSNILVTQQDGKALPKVIDFGIAKAIDGQSLTDWTVSTQHEQFLGTPTYTSPEQAGGGRDVDTRTDIYSLGVLLYELLTGKTPFDTSELVRSGWEAMRRTIQESEPDRPSTRLTTLSPEELSEIAKRRRTDPPKLIHIIRGDLDWIIMKCLEKERARRYATCSSLAEDLERHLKHEPVVARPASTVYRLQKMVRRNVIGFTAGTIAALALLTGFSVASWSFVKQKQAQAVLKFFGDTHVRRVIIPPSGHLRGRARLVTVSESILPADSSPNAWNNYAPDGEDSTESASVPVAAARGNPGVPPTPAVTNGLSRTGRSAGGGTAAIAAESETSQSMSGYVVSPATAGQQYPYYEARWWKWLMELPLTNSFGAVHPVIDSPFFDVREGQNGPVWFLATPFGQVRRTCVIPPDTWIFLGMLNSECSSLEDPLWGFHADGATNQAACAGFWSDHIVGIYCDIDGSPVPDLGTYRFVSPQFTFNAPTPWIYGTLGGIGTSVGDGFYLMISPLPPGEHVIHYGGAFQFRVPIDPFNGIAASEMVYSITVSPR